MVEMVKYSATGRRKNSVARVNLVPGKGVIKVNKREFDEYFPRETDRIQITRPLKAISAEEKFDVLATVTGGGISGQAGAMQLGLARAIVKSDENTKPVLKKELFLRRDPRMKERQKPGQKGARKKFQWVKR